MSEIMAGDKVEFIDEFAQAVYPKWCPRVGTIGTVIEIDPDGDILVEWPEGSTSKDDIWYVGRRMVRRVET